MASDFVRSALDMFAYVRESDDSLVLAAGVPAAWLEGRGIGLRGMRTPHGSLGYRLRREDGQLVLEVADDAGLPPGGLVLPWPWAGAPGAATVDGVPVQWEGRELRIRRAGARVVVDAGAVE